MFKIYHSNQLEMLKELMAILIERDPLPDPFACEVILVQSHGIAQWLQIELADYFEITANLRFSLPASFIWQMFTLVLPEISAESAFSKEAMTWKLMQILPDKLAQPEFTALKEYLADDSDQRKHYQLAARVADLFDQYLVYRPDWLTAWQTQQLVEGLDDNQAWQAILWRELIDYTDYWQQPPWHRANLYQRFIDSLNQGEVVVERLPHRVFICGISALPPVYLQALEALGQHIDIHFLVMNPCRFYWGDIQDYTFLAKLQARQRINFHHRQVSKLFQRTELASQLFNEQGEQQLSNPLLASWGKLGRDNLYLLAQLTHIQEVEAFVELEGITLLQCLQQDILQLDDHAQIGENAERYMTSSLKRELVLTDRSISFHACHSPQREVEVLHDYLLSILDAEPSLTPRDIIVMVADIDNYTPYIQAVFGNVPGDRYLPYAISDRRVSEAHPILQAFITLLNLPLSRCSAEDILALLDVPAIALRFGISELFLVRLHRWIKETGIRWGLDDSNQSELNLPVTGQNTWQFGLTRMLLGYAMESQSGDWHGILPYDDSSGLAAEPIGLLADFLTVLRQWRDKLSGHYRLADWLPVCQQLLADFFITDSETEPVLLLIEQQWQSVIHQGITAHFSGEIPLTILRDELASRLDNERISQRFLAGSINFCTLMPMRSIPFKVVCLLGMNDGVYPRILQPLGFDLMAQQVRKGDRSRRDDDRYLFLEALLSAQQQLYISYIGRSIQDNSLRYPSVLVTELIDYISQSHHLPGDERCNIDESAERVKIHLITWHARMPFSHENFIAGTTQQSYAREWLPAAKREAIWNDSFDQALPPLEISTLDFDGLRRFYQQPIRGFFQQRLQTYFSQEIQEIEGQEPFVIDGLTRYHIKQQLLNKLIQGEDDQRLFKQLRAAGELPYGAFGELFWLEQQQELTMLAEQILPLKQVSLSQEIAIEFDGLQLSGWLNQVQSDGLLRWRPAELSATDGMGLWLEHLVYCAQGGTGSSQMFGSKKSHWHFLALAPELAREELNRLVKGYLLGLCQPLLLFPKSSWAWLTSCYQADSGQIDWSPDTQERARQQFIKRWQGNQQQQGEGADLYSMRVLRVLTDEKFRQILEIGQSYLLPLMQCRQPSSR